MQSKIGTATFLGLYQSPWFNNEFPNINLPALLDSVEDKLGQADNHLNELYNGFFEPGSVTAVQGEMGEKRSGYSHVPDLYAAFWFHPDHLGSSNYITNLAGNVSQHMEYLPFGETLVEEHLNSNNSPYKFNGKELDEETGNYYYGARYYDPKMSIWLSVDPLAEKYPGWSPYNYTLLNPVNLVDPDGRSVAKPLDWYQNLETGNTEWYNGSEQRDGYEKIATGTNIVESDGQTFQLQEKGRFTDLNTGKWYSRGDEINDLPSGYSIKSHGSFFQESQTWVRHNKQDLLDVSHNLQNAGDGIAITGYGAAVVGSAVAGVGAAPGAAIAGIGEGVSTFGSTLEFGVNFMSGNYKSAGKNLGFYLGGEVIDMTFDRILPGPTPDISKDVYQILETNFTTVKPILIERGYDNSQK